MAGSERASDGTPSGEFLTPRDDHATPPPDSDLPDDSPLGDSTFVPTSDSRAGGTRGGNETRAGSRILRLRKLPPPKVPGHEILGRVGQGGMGIVYKARQVSLNRQVAIKLISRSQSASIFDLARFTREIEMLKLVDHPHVVRILDSGQTEPTPESGLTREPWFSMEYLPGGKLRDLIHGGPLTPSHACELVAKLARGVESIHRRGLIHRDLKPENVLFTTDLEPKITDFGLTRPMDPAAWGAAPTDTGTALGTPSYMSPEQAKGLKQLDPRSDVYSLGAMLYELLTGEPWIRAVSAREFREKLRDAGVPRPSRKNAKCPADLDAICERCLWPRPQGRYESAAALANDLEAFLRHERVAARQHGRFAQAVEWLRLHPRTLALVAVVLVACLGGLWRWNQYARYLRPQTEHYAWIVRRWGGPEGVLPVAESEITRRGYTLRATRAGSHGPIVRLEAIDAQGLLTDRHPVVDYLDGLATPTEASGVWLPPVGTERPRVWTFRYDPNGSGAVVGGDARRDDETVLYAFEILPNPRMVRTTVENDRHGTSHATAPRHVIIRYERPDGSTWRTRHGAARARVTFTAAGYDERVDYLPSDDDDPRQAADGAHGHAFIDGPDADLAPEEVHCLDASGRVTANERGHTGLRWSIDPARGEIVCLWLTEGTPAIPP